MTSAAKPAPRAPARKSPALKTTGLPAASEKRLVGVHPDLVRVVRRAAALTPGAFVITQGVRTMAEQRRLVAAGASRTLNSRHIPTGSPPLAHAVDVAALVGGKVRWDWPLYAAIAATVKEAARIERVRIDWGGDWANFRDGPHFELSRSAYP